MLSLLTEQPTEVQVSCEINLFFQHYSPAAGSCCLSWLVQPQPQCSEPLHATVKPKLLVQKGLAVQQQQILILSPGLFDFSLLGHPDQHP